MHVALIEPQIPPNTGNIVRLTAATGSPLHLIEPLGFELAAPELKRAGLDYWSHADIWVHKSWDEFRQAIGRDRSLYFSANATNDFWEAPFAPNSCLIFGNETAGMPAKLLAKYPERCFRIPMRQETRCLNLATAVGIVLYEGLRQLRGLE